MKRFSRMIAWLVAAVLLLSVSVCALADFEDPLYVSPSFRIPENRIISDPVSLADEDEEEPEVTVPEVVEPEEVEPEEAEPEATEPEAVEPEATEPAAEAEPEAEAQEGETEAAPEAEPQEGEQNPEAEPAEAAEPVEGEGAEGEQTAAPESGEQTEVQEGEPAAEPEPEPEIPKKVSIYTSRKDVVTDGERIYLTSYLEGFDGIEVQNQWQVDRGNGWENVEGATRDSYSFIATKETVLYSWRLIVYFDE